MTECLFCKIIQGKIPAHKIYENEFVLVFLDINPVAKGHLLVISKEHHRNIYDVTAKSLQEIILICKKMSFLVKEKLGATGTNIVNASEKDAQQSVFHIHFHVVPRYVSDGLDLWFTGRDFEKPNLEELKELLLN